ncbi:MAG TPA: alpha/beta hydrolase [Acidimicrobiales bacterium]|jgi:pimeloyl-ACP methyl ester carboxylesterase|nr:alpha/beta hydrolase [Acidimicrobiales bacterium]
MPVAQVNGLGVSYELIGNGEPWVVTPGGRFSKDAPGVRQLAERLAATGKQVVIWDRPNTGASEVCFEGDSESAMQADVLAGLLEGLGMTPAVIAGGSGGSRVSLLTAARHPEAARALALWWISGGPYGLLTLGTHYCGDSIAAAWRSGMEAVAALPDWAEVLERNPDNRPKLLAQDPQAFIRTLEQWMLVYCPRPDELVPGLPDAEARTMDLPALVFRSGESDPHHTRATSERLAELLPRAQLVEPPWGDREWNERIEAAGDRVGIFSRWPELAEQLNEWSARL